MKILVARRANHNISKLVVIISRPEKLRISYISFFLITHPVNLFLYKFASSENRDVSIRRRASHFYNDANFSLFTWEGREGEVQQKRNGSILFFRPKLRRSTILRRSFRAFRTSGEAALQRKLEKKTLRYTSFQSSKLRIVNVQRSHPRPQHYDSITLPTRTPFRCNFASEVVCLLLIDPSTNRNPRLNSFYGRIPSISFFKNFPRA